MQLKIPFLRGFNAEGKKQKNKKTKKKGKKKKKKIEKRKKVKCFISSINTETPKIAVTVSACLFF